MSKIFAILTSFLMFQGCELLQKREIELVTPPKEERSFKVLSYIFINQFAISETADPERAIRNYLSSTRAATLVTTKESSFLGWHQPTEGCLPINDTGIRIQRIRFNLDMGPLVLESLSTNQKYSFPSQQTNEGFIYGAWGWLPPSLYSFEYTQNPTLSFKESQIPTLETGGDIKIRSNTTWIQSARPDLDQSESYAISKTKPFSVRFQPPANANHAILNIQDQNNNELRCQTTFAENTQNAQITVPPSAMQDLTLSENANFEIKFINTRLTLTHPKIDEIFIESSTKHLFGQINIGNNQTLDLGRVQIID